MLCCCARAGRPDLRPVLVHLSAGFFLPAGYEFVLILGSAAIALVITGAGRYSVDAALAGRGTRTLTP